MHVFDFAPLVRSGVGFDRLARLAETASRMSEMKPSYPPYNIERHPASEADKAQGNGDGYVITVAVAGFAPSELSVEVCGETLTLSGHKAPAAVEAAEAPTSEPVQVLHHGIALRDFTRRFQLADGIGVTSAEIRDGLLVVTLRQKLPEQMKPRQIPILATRTVSLTETPAVTTVSTEAAPETSPETSVVVAA